MSFCKVLRRSTFIPVWGAFLLPLGKDLCAGGKNLFDGMAKRPEADKFSVGPTQPVKKPSRGVLSPEEYMLLG